MNDVMTPYHGAIAEKLSKETFPDLEVVDGIGILLKRLPHAEIYITKMTFVNWRLVDNEPGNQFCWRRAWCYSGTSELEALLGALAAVMQWDGALDTEPTGWIKSVHDQRHNPDHYMNAGRIET